MWNVALENEISWCSKINKTVIKINYCYIEIFKIQKLIQMTSTKLNY